MEILFPNSTPLETQFKSNPILSNYLQFTERERERENIPGIENDWGKQIEEEEVLTKH